MAVVDVWVAPLDVAPPVLARLVASLSPAERARAERYRDPADARRFSAARGWLRHTLGAATGMAPGRVPLTEGPGKPRLAGGRGPCFNLSHAGELGLIAVADRAVGVDVEHTDSGRRALDAVAVACTPREAAALRRLPAAERADAFLRCWTTKEAFLKATGVGLGVAPTDVEIGTGTQEPAGALPVGLAGDPPRWWARRLRPAPGYVAAVVAEGRDWSVRLRHVAQEGFMAAARPVR